MRELRGGLEPHDGVTVALDGARERVDGLRRVVLGFAVVAVVRVDALHVEGEAHPQRGAARPRSRLGGVEQREEVRSRGGRAQNGEHRRVVVEARGLGRREERRVRLEAGQGGRREEVHLAVEPDAEVQGCGVAKAERLERAVRELAHPLQEPRRDAGRDVPDDLCRVGVLERVVEDVEAARVRGADRELDRRKARSAVHLADADVGAGDVALDQRTVGVGGQ